MGKHEKKKSSPTVKSSKSGKTKFIAIGVGIAIVVAIGIGLAISMGNNVPSDSSNSRTVPWIHVHGLGIDPSDASVLYIATHGDFYKSVDGGVPVKVDKQRADYMAFNAPLTEGVPLYSSGHPSTGGNTGLIKSTDGGQTWQVVSTVLDPPVDFHAMSVSASDPDTIIGFDSGERGLFKTTDAGSTWDKFDYPGKYVIALAIAPDDPNVIFAGTPSGLFQSNDSAESWTQLDQYKGIAVMALTFDAEGNLYASTEEFGLAKSSDLGKSWENINRPPDNLIATSIAVDSENKLLYVAGHSASQGYQEVFRGSLDGSDWQLVGTNKAL
ncbi:BNR repeat-containing glycosyl hydrolase [Candidatus Nitrososphaera gargensis Ga9.2]|uniref:BNR repeat-containing glycosyl hydrolase n=1 Tax=Nitrososphaera gargensis (strain Ga9.2) TaxID=1237085 RepID=K0I8M3_NITGG|nr:glycosyl hydrolase [Candidatus Nitrososphaera gargensis]AFU57631.1 BNR repeat-containing glycosyl hydrolase [Candidatus Nitrososphaera gargensis Ga9.2]